MNKSERTIVAKQFREVEIYAGQLSNVVYNIANQDAHKKDRQSWHELVRKFDASNNHLRDLLKKYDIISER